MPAATRESKRCVHCGRRFEWRKKWARDWPQVKTCSDACRRGVLPVDTTIDAVVLALLARRPSGSTICPSEAARSHAPDDWRAAMPRVHDAVARLEAIGRVVVTQGGEVVALEGVRGAYRVRLP
jgi:hypothetical protein